MPRSRLRSGTLLVAAMFAFGVALTAGLYAYWSLHTAPFVPIIESLDARYPGSDPRVEGGKPRLDRPGEAVLRIVMKVSFDPGDDARASSFGREVAAFVAGRHDLGGFERIEVHLFRPTPEQALSQRTVGMRVEDAVRAAENASRPAAARETGSRP